MLQKICQTPLKYYHLVLFNMALILALFKGLSLLHIIFSLAFIASLAALIAHALRFIQAQTVKIIHEDIVAKFRCLVSSSVGCLKSVSEGEESKRIKLIIGTLLAIYVSINFLCPCLQTLLFCNAVFIYFYMQEEVEKAQYYLCNSCEGACSQ